MARFIFISPIILVCFLTIVSKTAYAGKSSKYKPAAKIISFSGNDTITSILNENFESGTLLSGWEQTNDWEISGTEAISGTFSLKHSVKSISSNSILFHSINADLNSSDIEWSFRLKNGNWDPSSSNRFWFYLSADTIQSDIVNGYAVGVNISGTSDLLQLWRIMKGKADSLIVQTDLDWNASTAAGIYAKRSSRGQWTLNYQKAGESISMDFTGRDPKTFSFKNIGLLFDFTSTRAGQLWIDDIMVNQLPSELFIQKLLLINSGQLSLTFNKPVNSNSIYTTNFRLYDENNQTIAITQTQLAKGSDKSVEISFGKTNGIELSLSVSGITDLSGKTMNPDTKSFFYSFSPEVGSVLINEVLFNPFSGGVDFVELVNVSEQIIPVNQLMLASRNDTLALKQIYPLSTEKRYLGPGEFIVCTKDSAILSAQYFNHNPESFCMMKTLPSFPDDAGTVVILNDSLEVLDEFSYLTKMHSPFLADENGVSLERISLNKPTSDRNNWASAAASIGFATPGLQNSQMESEIEIKDEITPEPKVFSPNGDGYNNELKIKYRFGKPGYMASVRIFDAIGRQVNFLVKNESIAQEGSWLWDGKSGSGQKQNIGVYIILVEIFDQAGHTKAFKKACTLTDRLD